MTPERWRQVTDVFHAALACRVQDRGQFLRDACADDRDLREEVGAMLSESPGTTQFAPGQRAPGHGVWSHTSGLIFSARIVGMILFDTAAAPPAPGVQAGWQLIVSTFTLTSPDTLNLSATVQFFDINRQLYRSACPTGTAERFR